MSPTIVVSEDSLHSSLAQPHLPGHYLSWGAIVAGGLCAAAISFVLLTFGGCHRDEQTEIRLFGTKYSW